MPEHTAAPTPAAAANNTPDALRTLLASHIVTPPEKSPDDVIVRHEGILAYARHCGCSYKDSLARLLSHNIWPERLYRNTGAFTPAQMLRVLQSRVLIAGCGGLGGHAAASLARLGVGDFVLCDPDIFEESNLNRQYFCTEATLGRPKAHVCRDGIHAIAPYADINARICALTTENIPPLLHNVTAVLDCVDTIPRKKMLEHAARDAGIIYIHGAVSGLEAFAFADNPAGSRLDKLYPHTLSGNLSGEQVENAYATPVFTVSGTAALMVGLLVQCFTSAMPVHSPLLHMDYSVPEMQAFHA